MVTRQIELTDEENERLERIAAESGRSVADLLREGLGRFLPIELRPGDRGLRERAAAASGRFRSRLKDLSTGHDRYLDA
jgi:Ribbon-helix-helix protein, copG family